MSDNYGFVYLLSNPSMPDIYKIGMTDRAPSQRVVELSKSTSIPTPFELILCAEVWDAQSFESRIHMHFANNRVNSQREFFRLDSGNLSFLRDYLREECKGVFFESEFIDEKEYEEFTSNEIAEERRKIVWFFQQNADPIDWRTFGEWAL